MLKHSPLPVGTEDRVSPQAWCTVTDGDSRLQQVQNRHQLSQRPPSQSVFSFRVKTVISSGWEETHRHVHASPDSINNKLGLLNSCYSSGIQIMSVITFCSLDAVLHVVICSLQCSSLTWIHMLEDFFRFSSLFCLCCCCHSGFMFTDESSTLNGFDEFIYGCVLVPAFPTRWPTMHALVRFNLSLSISMEIIKLQLLFHIGEEERKMHRKPN